MAGETTATFEADATVVRGGNIRYEIAVPVEIRDSLGDVWWESYATTTIDLPAGRPSPDVRVPAHAVVRTRGVPRDDS